MCSIYVAQLVWALAAPLVMRVRKHKRGVAYVRHCPYPVVRMCLKSRSLAEMITQQR